MGDETFSNPNQSRVQQLWAHLAGLFGADALKRKFGVRAPAEWTAALAALNDAQLKHGLEALLVSGSKHVPTLPEFIAMCRNYREWAKPIAPLIEDGTDKWAREANKHLYAYVVCNKAPLRVHPDSKYSPELRHVIPGPIGARRTMMLVRQKNAWAQCMREEAGELGTVSIETQQAAWKLFMQKAEDEIAADLKTLAA